MLHPTRNTPYWVAACLMEEAPSEKGWKKFNPAEKKVSHPTREEYEAMDRVRFPFVFTEENLKKERKRSRIMKRGRMSKLEERINRLIEENEDSFFDPRIGEEIILRRGYGDSETGK